MEINRENGDLDTITFEFRLYAISEELSKQLNEELIKFEFSFEIFKIRKSNFYTILFQLEDSFFDAETINDLIAKYNISNESFGYWITFTSEYGHGGLTIPNWLLKLQHKTGGALDFSYIISNE